VPTADPERVLRALADHEVSYLLIGGMAAMAHGWPGSTADIDLLAAHTPEARDALAAALVDLGAEAERFDGTGESLLRSTAWSFDTDAGPVDVLFVLEPRGTYRELEPTKHETEAFGVVVPLISLDDLIRVKQELGRPKDLRVATELEALRAERDRD
jgi:hypothetical protein